MEWRDPNTGQIKMWVWAIAGLGFVVVLFLFSKVAGSGQTTTGSVIPAEGQSSDITEYLNQISDALDQLLPPGNIPTPDPDPDPDPDPNPNPNPNRPNPMPRQFMQYKIKSGDTWTTVANTFGMTLRQFFKHNPTLKTIGTPTKERSGGRMVKVFQRAVDPIPTSTPTSYTVKKGDTWKSISNQFDIRLRRLYKLNPNIPRNPLQKRQGGREVIVGTANVN